MTYFHVVRNSSEFFLILSDLSDQNRKRLRRRSERETDEKTFQFPSLIRIRYLISVFTAQTPFYLVSGSLGPSAVFCPSSRSSDST